MSAVEGTSFFEPLGEDRYRATIHTRGPWDERFQHGGPPSALLVRELQRLAPDPDAMLSRICVEILGPIPVGELRASARIARPGRSVQLLEATLSAGGRDVARATAWQLKRNTSADLPSKLRAAPPLPTAAPFALPPGWIDGYLSAMEWRMTLGGLSEEGPGIAWVRQRVPLLPDEEPSGLQRLLAVADSGNGISWEIDIRTHTFMNTDLTVHVYREPVGEWICLDARTDAATGGVGLATSVLSDAEGAVGVGAQTLLIAAR